MTSKTPQCTTPCIIQSCTKNLFIHRRHRLSGEFVRTIQKIAKNIGVIITGNVIFRLVSLFVIIYLAQYLGAAGFGKYSFVFAYLAFFNIITDLGPQQILVREMARNPSTPLTLIGNAYIIRLLLTVFAVVLSIVTINLLPYPADTTLYVCIASFTLLFAPFRTSMPRYFGQTLRWCIT